MTGLPRLRGRVAFVFDEPDFDVDAIVGVENIKLQQPAELAALAMRRYDAGFARAVQPGDLLVGGSNFGYGHPHYPPMIAMRHLGIAGVIAESFSPGYWRGEISMGFPQIPCAGVLGLVRRWDEVEVDWERSEVRNLTRGAALPFTRLPEADLHMLRAGGLIGYLREKLAPEAST